MAYVKYHFVDVGVPVFFIRPSSVVSVVHTQAFSRFANRPVFEGEE